MTRCLTYCVTCVCQVTAVVPADGAESGDSVTPALGLAWSSQLTTRLTAARTGYSLADRSASSGTGVLAGYSTSAQADQVRTGQSAVVQWYWPGTVPLLRRVGSGQVSHSGTVVLAGYSTSAPAGQVSQQYSGTGRVQYLCAHAGGSRLSRSSHGRTIRCPEMVVRSVAQWSARTDAVHDTKPGATLAQR